MNTRRFAELLEPSYSILTVGTRVSITDREQDRVYCLVTLAKAAGDTSLLPKVEFCMNLTTRLITFHEASECEAYGPILRKEPAVLLGMVLQALAESE